MLVMVGTGDRFLFVHETSFMVFSIDFVAVILGGDVHLNFGLLNRSS